MTQDEIIRMAREAGFEGLIEKEWGRKQIERFAAPVRTKDLTDDEIDEIPFNRVSDDPLLEYARAVIAADREKNK